MSHALMVTGLYPLVPHAYRAIKKQAIGERPVRAALVEWGISAALSTVRPAGFLPLPGSRTKGPRPIIVLHGYAQNRAVFMPLAYRLRSANLGPIFGFEYWTLGRVAAGARQLGWFVDQVRDATGAEQVDIIGHSMGGVVARYYVSLAGGDGIVKNLVTIGSPHAGTDVSKLGIGHPTRELLLGSKLTMRLAHAPSPQHTRVTLIWSNADALVPGAWQLDQHSASLRDAARPGEAGAFVHDARGLGAEVVMFEDLGHVALLGSRRVAATIVERLAT